MLQRVMSVSCRKIFASQCQKVSGWNPSVLCFRKILVAKKYLFKSGGGTNIKIFRQKCFSHTPENSRRGNF